MFPFLYVTLWRIVKGNRRTAEREPATDENHNRDVGGRARRRTMSARKRRAYVVMAVAIAGLGIPLLLIGLRSILYAAHERNHPRMGWRPHRPDYSRILMEREDGMRRYQFPHNRTGVDKRLKLSLREFVDVYDGKWPVIISDVVTRWRAHKLWSEDYLKSRYGEEKVSVRTHEYGVNSGASVSVAYFIRHLSDGQENKWSYLEDEHFISLRPELKQDIGETVYTLDDMFRQFPDSVRPWDCMLLWGTAYSRSPLHMDPYNWTGTNAVLRGYKRWRLFPPGQDHLLHVKPGQKCHFPLDCVKYNSPVDAFSRDLSPRARFLEVDQYAGELLFIPSGWFHQALNIEPTLAVSGQLMNKQNYLTVLEEILRANTIPVHNLPSSFYSLSPDDQLRLILARIPKHVLDHGADVTREARQTHE